MAVRGEASIIQILSLRLIMLSWERNALATRGQTASLEARLPLLQSSFSSIKMPAVGLAIRAFHGQDF
jgi:hypothetical protein